MYQSLYRTYRPSGFDEIVGQEAIVKTLKNQILSDRIAHAYLFCGTRGTGKTSAARIMAQAVNCENPLDASPCHECSSCKSIANESSLDVFEMDAASNSKVDEIRDLLEKVQYPPQFSKYKVYIIDEVHMLSNAAFNALLKTLEEPPSYMIFILATTEPQKLPATILSRCQRFDFGRINEESIIKRLKIATRENASDSALQLIASAAEGSMRDAWSLLEVCINSEEYLSEDNVRSVLGAVSRDFLNEYTKALAIKDSEKIQACVNRIINEGKDVQVFLRDYTRLIKALIAIKLNSTSSEYYSSDEGLVELASFCRLDWLVLLLENAVHAEAEAKWAASPGSILLLFSMKACFIGDEKSLLSFSSRLSRLEGLVSDMQNGISPKAQSSFNQAPIHQSTKSTSEAIETKILSESIEKIQTIEETYKKTEESPQIGDIKPENIPSSADLSEVINSDNEDAISNDNTHKINEIQSKAEISCLENKNPENSSQIVENQTKTVEKASEEAIKASESNDNSMTVKDYERIWNKMLIKWLPSVSPSKHPAFRTGHYSGFSDDCYKLVYNSDEVFQYSLVSNPSFIETIEKYLSENIGRKITLKIQLLGENDKKVGQNINEELLNRMISLCGKEKVEVK